MEKIYGLLKKLGIELTADQKKQPGEVAEDVVRNCFLWGKCKITC